MFYIYESDKHRSIKGFFNCITVYSNKIEVPHICKTRIISKPDGRKIVKKKDYKKKEAQLKELAKRTVRFLRKTNTKKIVLCKRLIKETTFTNGLYENGFEIINGRFLFKVLAPEILEYIIAKKKLNIDELRIVILANDLDYVVEDNIIAISEKYKNINIVTRNVNKFKPLLSNLYENEGIVIVVTNNKKRSLSKANIILNFDFTEELINKYVIYDNANIINFKEKIRIYKKRFNGSNINNYEIALKKDKLEEIVNFDEKLIKQNYIRNIYESVLYKNQPVQEIRKKMKQDNIEIKYLLGNHEKINS